MTERENLMYKILGKISDMGAPIIFKGALITKLILAEHEFSEIERMTKDIDANWIADPPSMTVLAQTINQSLGELQEQYVAVVSREYGERQSAGISIREKSTGDDIISMDIDIKPLIDSKVYFFGETSIKGVLANEILADKISSMSSDAIYKHRAKDLIDVYALTHCVEIHTLDIYDVCDKAKRKIYPFSAFNNRKEEIEHAYNKLKGIDGKPAFSAVYDYLKEFVKPFEEKDYTNKRWDSKLAVWNEARQITASMNNLRNKRTADNKDIEESNKKMKKRKLEEREFER